jgi:hypothetical protein
MLFESPMTKLRLAQRPTLVALLTMVAAVATFGCSSLLTADPTPVPGAAATLTRSLRTPIPTTVQSPVPAAAVSPAPSRVATSASPGPSPAANQSIDEDDLAQLQRRMAQITSNSSLPGIEALLLDHVSLSTAQGGAVMDSVQAANWLRDRAGAGIKVNRLERGTQTLMVQVFTDGWPPQDPIQLGQVSFSLRKYDANGRPNDETGDWKIDVIDAE